jgi:hypothetical protein
MNSPVFKIASVVFSAALFALVFYKQNLGINLLLFELFIISLLAINKRFTRNTEVVLALSGTLITAVMVVIHNSLLSVFINIIRMYVMVGVILLPTARSLPHSVALSVIHSVVSQYEFFKQLAKLGNGNSTFRSALKWLRIILIPILVVFLFAAIYSAANPVFDGILETVTSRINAIIEAVSNMLDVGLVFFFIFGMICCDFLLLKTTQKELNESVINATDDLKRTRKYKGYKTLNIGIKREWRSGIILLASLNALLLLVNCIDVYWVWFNFEWNGDYLKQFVHEGTSLLIISIIISIGISLYLFRGNQNFFSKNIWLKRLTLIWLFQNGVLAFSVGVRNWHYISYYALAYKRIGVFFFLLATLIGLVIVMYKISQRKSFHYVLRTNAISIFSILIIMTLFNWDVIIAKYNFKHADTSFVHLDFMIQLSNAALPHLSKDKQTLVKIEEGNTRFPSDVEYLTANRYIEHIHDRKLLFKKEFNDLHWLSWNLADQRAYDRLFSQ